MPTYLHHFILNDVADVFDAQAIWQAQGLPLFSRKPQLRDLLERHPRAHKGRNMLSCFAHVCLQLPSAQLDDDNHLYRSQHAQELLATLRELHRQDFADFLQADEVRYQIVADKNLGENQVGVLFGHALYLASANENPQYLLEYSQDSAIWQPIGAIYPQQRLCLLGATGQTSAFNLAHWPSALAGTLLLINDGPDSALQLQAKPAHAFEIRHDASQNYHILSATQQDGRTAHKARLFIRIKPQLVKLAAQAKRTPQVWQTRPPTPAAPPRPSATLANSPALDGSQQNSWHAASHLDKPPTEQVNSADNSMTWIARAQPSISLVALALPRLSRYPESGLQDFALGFDQDLRLQSAGQGMLEFSLDQSDLLQVRSAQGRQEVQLPARFEPHQGRVLKLEAASGAMQELYACCLHLPQVLRAAIPLPERIRFGRGMPQLAQLRVLEQLATGGQVCLDRLGLSRHAFSMQHSGKTFKIWRESAHQSLFHLDQDLHLIAALPEQAEQAYVLPSGHHLVAGNYVLRLDA